MGSHLQSYPCPLQINYFWNLGFLLGIAILLQIVTGILLALHYTSDINSAYFSVLFLIREVYYGWCLRYFHSSGASFVFLFLFLHLSRAMFYASYFYNPNTWFCGGYCLHNPTLKRFFVFHFLLPFLLIGFLSLHLFNLHLLSSNNPLRNSTNNKIPFLPFIVTKDIYVSIL